LLSNQNNEDRSGSVVRNSMIEFRTPRSSHSRTRWSIYVVFNLYGHTSFGLFGMLGVGIDLPNSTELIDWSLKLFIYVFLRCFRYCSKYEKRDLRFFSCLVAYVFSNTCCIPFNLQAVARLISTFTVMNSDCK
jgi:hypothetical protein